jgi:hypothetical protein
MVQEKRIATVKVMVVMAPVMAHDKVVDRGVTNAI